MKIRTDFAKDKGIFIFPVIAIDYRHKDIELAFVFLFACWSFTIDIYFK